MQEQPQAPPAFQILTSRQSWCFWGWTLPAGRVTSLQRESGERWPRRAVSSTASAPGRTLNFRITTSCLLPLGYSVRAGRRSAARDFTVIQADLFGDTVSARRLVACASACARVCGRAADVISVSWMRGGRPHSVIVPEQLPCTQQVRQRDSLIHKQTHKHLFSLSGSSTLNGDTLYTAHTSQPREIKQCFRRPSGQQYTIWPVRATNDRSGGKTHRSF